MAKGRLHRDIVEVQTVGLSVYLQQDPPVGGCPGDLVEIEHCPATSSEQAAGRVRQDVYCGMGKRPEQPSSLFPARQSERGVQ